MPYGYVNTFDSKVEQSKFGIYIYMCRKLQNISLNSLASLIGIDPSYLSSIEKGKKTPSKTMMEDILDGLDVKYNIIQEDANYLNRFKVVVQNFLTNQSYDDNDQVDFLLSNAYLESSYFIYVIAIDYIRGYYDDMYEQVYFDEMIDIVKDFFDASVKYVISYIQFKRENNQSKKNLYLKEINEYVINNQMILSPTVVGVVKLNIAQYHFNLSRCFHAYELALEAEKIFQSELYMLGLIAVKELKAKLYALTKEYDLAIDSYLQISKHLETYNELSGIEKCNQCIALIYFDLGDYNQALSFIEKIQDIDIGLDLIRGLCIYFLKMESNFIISDDVANKLLKALYDNSEDSILELLLKVMGSDTYLLYNESIANAIYKYAKVRQLYKLSSYCSTYLV